MKLKVLIDRGREERVLEVAKSISIDSYKSNALIEISKVLMEVGKEGEGEKILEESLEVEIYEC